MQKGPFVAMAILCLTLPPVASAEEANETTVVTISAEQTLSSSWTGLPVPGANYSVDLTSDVNPIPAPTEAADGVSALDSDFLRVQSDGVESETLGLGFSIPRGSGIGLFHDGALHLSDIACECESWADRSSRQVANTTTDGAEDISPIRAGESERRHLYDVGDESLAQLPYAGYRMDTRRVGVHIENGSSEASTGDGNVTDKPASRGHSPFEPYSMPYDDPAPEPLAEGIVPSAFSWTATKPGPTGGPENRHLLMTVQRGDPPTPPLAVIATAAVGLAVFAFFALYSLFHPKDLLQNTVRGKIYAEIEANPGITIARLAEIVGVKHQTVSYHLKFLRKAGYITDIERGNRRQHFIAGAGLSEEDRVLLTISQDASTMNVLSVIAGSPGIIKRDLCVAVQLTKTAANWHINKLLQLGVIAQTRVHGHCHLDPGERYERLMALLARPPTDPATSAQPSEDGDTTPTVTLPAVSSLSGATLRIG